MSKNGIGHNSGALTEDQQKALSLGHHLPMYVSALRAKKEADARFKNACKLIKSEGTSIDDIKLMIALDTDEGEAALREKISRQIQIARWMDAEIGHQFDFLDIPDRRPDTERAFAEGKIAGMRGEVCSTSLSGEAEQEWIRGWQEGQAALMSALDLTKAGVADVAGEPGATVISGEEAEEIRRERSPPDDDPFEDAQALH